MKIVYAGSEEFRMLKRVVEFNQEWLDIQDTFLGESPLVTIDRTNTIPNSYVQSIFPATIPYDANYSKSFEDTVMEVAAEYAGKDVRVFWSGGIDSTLVALALKEVGANVLLLATHRSVEEYPGFEDQGNFEIIFGDTPYDLSDVDQLSITGEFGDFLFTPRLFFEFATNITLDEKGHISVMTSPWRDRVYNREGRTVKPLAEALIEELVNKCPFEIVSTAQFRWWCRMTIRWQSEYLRMFMSATAEDFQKEFINLRHFYADDLFVKWSAVQFRDRLLETRAKPFDFKAESKALILKLGGDTEYFLTKAPQGSLIGIKPWRCRMEDGSTTSSLDETITLLGA